MSAVCLTGGAAALVRWSPRRPSWRARWCRIGGEPIIVGYIILWDTVGGDSAHHGTRAGIPRGGGRPPTGELLLCVCRHVGIAEHVSLLCAVCVGGGGVLCVVTRKNLRSFFSFSTCRVTGVAVRISALRAGLYTILVLPIYCMVYAYKREVGRGVVHCPIIVQ